MERLQRFRNPMRPSQNEIWKVAFLLEKMDMKPRKTLQNQLRKELEKLSKTSLTEPQSFEAYHNLSGFLRVLNQMKKETKYGNVQD